jgi:hypothetical protein
MREINAMKNLALVVSLVLTGCATSHVVPTGKNTYLASVRFCGVCTAAVVATEAAAKYCAARGQVSTVTNLNTVFGSGAADVQFTCSSVEDQKPSRRDNGISTIEVK